MFYKTDLSLVALLQIVFFCKIINLLNIVGVLSAVLDYLPCRICRK